MSVKASLHRHNQDRHPEAKQLSGLSRQGSCSGKEGQAVPQQRTSPRDLAQCQLQLRSKDNNRKRRPSQLPVRSTNKSRNKPTATPVIRGMNRTHRRLAWPHHLLQHHPPHRLPHPPSPKRRSNTTSPPQIPMNYPSPSARPLKSCKRNRMVYLIPSILTHARFRANLSFRMVALQKPNHSRPRLGPFRLRRRDRRCSTSRPTTSTTTRRASTCLPGREWQRTWQWNRRSTHA
jgi:hypothetical protein